MMMQKPIDSITFDDVVEFCEHEVPEGAQLDYKGDFPNDLGKAIAAMANTFGGLSN